MLASLNQMFDTSGFMPHGHCFLWTPSLLWSYVISDSIIAASYYSIPVALWYFVRKRQDLPYRWIFAMFGVFVMACGTTHLFAIWNIWHADYWAEAGTKVITAGASIVTAILLWPLIPKALAIASQQQLARANQELQYEVKRREQAENELREMNSSLEERIAKRTCDLQNASDSLTESNARLRAQARRLLEHEQLLRENEKRLEGVLATTMEGVISIDEQQRIMLFNPAAEQMFGRTATEMIGQPLGILVPEHFRAQHDEDIRRFSDTGQTSRPMGKYARISGLRANGEEFPIEATISRSTESDNKLFTVMLRDITDRRQAEQALRDYAERLHLLSRRLFEVEESERRRLARELHDSIGQNVTALRLNLRLLHGDLPDERTRKTNALLADCQVLLDKTAQLIRNVMADLRPPGLDELGLVAALTEHARQVTGRAGFTVTISGIEVAPRLPSASEIALFRIAQEALTNVAKHAQATTVTIALESAPDTAVLIITDDGCGFDTTARPAQPRRSLGMVSMSERAEAIGARLSVESTLTRGTRVSVKAPRSGPGASDRANLPGLEPA